jgi:uncharacterized membrane protein YhaH (DUF805 family)
VNWFLIALKKYATFEGRAQRSEYWYFVLFYVLIYIGLAILDGLMSGFSRSGSMGILAAIFSLAMFVPSLAVGVRRLHDTGRSGWWLLIALIPLIGAIVLLVFNVQDSDPGSNQYGENPKGA